MFDIGTFKMYSKRMLKNRWNIPVFVTLILICAYFLQGILDSKFQNFNRITIKDSVITELYISPIYYFSIILISLVGSIFVFSNIYFFIAFRKSTPGLETEKPEEVESNKFYEGFYYWNKAILSKIWKSLWIYLWSLLFFIPAIVKSFAYSQMNYILAENPKISVRKAMKMSIKMTQGFKAELFILELSFLGWFLLCGLSMGILFLYFNPYYSITKLNAYYFLKQKALQTGVLSQSDFEVNDNNEDDFDKMNLKKIEYDENK